MAMDTRIYATVLHSDHSLQYSLTVAVNILATPLNLLSFYLILFKSKREIFSYKVMLFLSKFAFYIAELHLGVLTGLVTLHPFPGMYSVGLLKNYFSTFTLCFTWTNLFCLFAYTSFLQLFIRLRVVAKPGKFFDRSNLTYSIVYILLAIYIFTPLQLLMFIANSSLENMQQFVRRNYPNNMMVFENPGVFILTDNVHTDWIQAIMMILVGSAVILVLVMYLFIKREIRMSATSRSGRHSHDNQKHLHSSILQSLSHVFFLALAGSLIFKTFFNDPSVDSRISNAIAFTSLCGASIPYHILLIYRNPSYWEFVMEKLNLQTKPPVHRHSNVGMKI